MAEPPVHQAGRFKILKCIIDATVNLRHFRFKCSGTSQYYIKETDS